jgi:peptidylprolyl isomerase
MLVVPACSGGTPDPDAVIVGDTVLVNYTGKLSDGTQFDSTAGKEPFKFKVGSGQVIVGFDKAVIGMKVGQKKTVTIPAVDAYGKYNKDMVQELPRSRFTGVTPVVGMQFQVLGTDDASKNFPARVTKVTDTTVTLDANLPLAGKDLTFDLELVQIVK